MQGKDMNIKPIQLKILYFVAFVSPFLSLFSGAALAPVYIIVTLLPLIMLIKSHEFDPLYKPFLSKIVLALFAYGAVSALWAIRPDETVDLLYRMVLIFIGAVALFEFSKDLEKKEKCNIAMALFAGFVLALIAANIEIFSGGVITKFFRGFQNGEHVYELTDLNRGSAYLSLLFWPVAASFLVRGRALAAIAILAVTVITILRLESQSASIAVILGVAAFLFVYMLGKKGITAIMVFTVLAVGGVTTTAKLMDPAKMFKVIPQVPDSASEIRLYIWHYAAKRASEKPILGWGFNASRSIPVPLSDYVLNGRHPLPLHPHNNVMQMWLELGVFGIVIFTMFLLAIMQYIKSRIQEESHCEAHPALQSSDEKKCRITACIKGCRNNLHAALLMGFVANYFAIGETGFGIWQNWWVASGIIATGFLLAILRK